MRTYDCNRHTSPDKQSTVGAVYAAEALADMPASVDLRGICPPVYNQGQLGSCTGFSIAKGMLEIVRRKAGLPAPSMSALYLYYFERAAEHTTDLDHGASICDGTYVLLARGCATEATDPYEIANFAQRPTVDCDAEALSFKVKSAQHLHTLEDMLNCLAAGYPFVGGIDVFASFESQEVASSGIVPMPNAGEQLMGGHAVCFVGYDRAKGMFLVRNSWGQDWGQNGYFWLPFQYALGYGSDYWTVRT